MSNQDLFANENEAKSLQQQYDPENDQASTFVPRDLLWEIPPELRIVQANSTAAREAGLPEGDIYLKGKILKSYGKSVQVVPLFTWESRALWRNGKWLCRSNGATTSGQAVQADGNVIACCPSQCEHGRWKTENDGRRIQPACQRQVNFRVWLPQHDDVDAKDHPVLPLRSTQFDLARTILREWKHAKVEMYLCALQLGTVRQSNSFGHFWGFQLIQWDDGRLVRIISPDKLSALAEVSERYAKQFDVVRATVKELPAPTTVPDSGNDDHIPW